MITPDQRAVNLPEFAQPHLGRSSAGVAHEWLQIFRRVPMDPFFGNFMGAISAY